MLQDGSATSSIGPVDVPPGHLPTRGASIVGSYLNS